ncbi:MAG: SDR family NAD(P)-dependent oxidoreductase [Candidatus Kapabacteria bacterium]|nr:SDR family NAD(P)-dependent oxidoreductase [Candidatus Kapabacteria bacterium]
MLKGKTVVITGASSGIGAACAEVCARARANIVLIARREDKLRAVVESLPPNVQSRILMCDVRNYGEVETALATLDGEWAAPEILINNAGLSRGLAPLQTGLLSDWEEMIDTNVKGLLYVTKEVLPGMIARGTGTIVNIASIAGRQTYPNGNVYCATKAAVRALSESLQYDTLGTGVRVTNIDPGMVETEFSEVRFHGDTERAKKVYDGMTPLTARDVAETVLYCITRPPHISIQDILLMPSAQASVHAVHRQPTSA